MFLPASEQAGLLLAQDLVNTAVAEDVPFVIRIAGKTLALATRDTVLKISRCDRDAGRLDLG